jgi:hypothetical protein
VRDGKIEERGKIHLTMAFKTDHTVRFVSVRCAARSHKVRNATTQSFITGSAKWMRTTASSTHSALICGRKRRSKVESSSHRTTFASSRYLERILCVFIFVSSLSEQAFPLASCVSILKRKRETRRLTNLLKVACSAAIEFEMENGKKVRRTKTSTKLCEIVCFFSIF